MNSIVSIRPNASPLTAVSLAAAAVLASASVASHAADVALSGNLAFHNDIVHIDFSLATAASEVRIWTDSWRSGLNFDPTGAVWASASAGYSLLLAVDDDDAVAPEQGFYDFGFVLPTLAAGSYRLTLATAINVPNGTLLTQGFGYDAEAPIPIALWMQPSFDPNANDQKGSFWRVNFSGVTSASVVPEPATWLLWGLGLAGIAARRLRRPSGD